MVYKMIDKNNHHILFGIRQAIFSSIRMYYIKLITVIKNTTLIPIETIQMQLKHTYIKQTSIDMSNISGELHVHYSPIERFVMADEIKWSDGIKHNVNNVVLLNIRPAQSIHIKFKLEETIGTSMSIPAKISFKTENKITEMVINSFGQMSALELVKQACNVIIYNINRYIKIFENRDKSIRILIESTGDKFVTIKYPDVPVFYSTLIGQHFIYHIPHNVAIMTYGFEHLLNQGMVFHINGVDPEKQFIKTLKHLKTTYEDKLKSL